MHRRNMLWFGLIALMLAYTTFFAAAQGATRIQYGDTVEGRIASSVERWEFVGTQDDVIVMQINRTAGNLAPSITLTDPTGVLITSLDWPSAGPAEIVMTAMLRASGPHTLTIGSTTTTGSYTLGLRLQQAGTQAESMLAYGRVVSSTIDNSTFREFWIFRGTQGDVIDVAMNATTGDLDAYLSLVSPQGEVLVTADAGGTGTDAALYAVVLPTTGNYSVVARRAGEDFGEAGTTQGTYTLALTLRRAGSVGGKQTPAGLTPGISTRGRLNADVPTALYSVDASGVLALALDMTQPAQIGTLTVMTTDGVLLNTFSGITPVRASVTLPQPATYWIEVSANNLQESTPVDFGITVEQLAIARRVARPLLYDRPQQVMGSSPQPETWYFHGRMGDLVDVTIALFNSELNQTALQITGPDGALLVTRPVRAAITQSLLLAQSGVYEITFAPAISSDGYQITVYRRGMSGLDFKQHTKPGVQGALPIASPAQGTLAAGGADRWFIDIQEAQLWEFRLEQMGSDVPAALVIEAPDGTWLGIATTDRLANSATLRVNLPYAGRYHALVFDPTQATTHTYTLRGAPGEGGYLPLDTTAKGVLTIANPVDRWVIYVPPEMLLSLKLTRLAGTSNPDIHIISPDGLLFATNTRGERRDSLVLMGIPVTYGGRFEIVIARSSGTAPSIYQIEAHVTTAFGPEAAITPAVDRPVNELFVTDTEPTRNATQVQLTDWITPRIQPDAEFLSAASSLEFATLERGAIETGQPYQAWRFSANAGQMIAFSVAALDSPSTPDLIVLTPEGTVLAENYQAAATNNYLMHRFGTSGTYMLVVSLEHTGRYTLFAEVLAQIDETVAQIIPGQALTYGNTLYGEITHEVQHYVFWGKAGDTIHARALRTAGTARLSLSLVELDGAVLRQTVMADTPPLAEIVEFALPDDALYQLLVAREGEGVGVAGQFALSLAVTRTSALKRDGGLLVEDQPRIASLETNDSAHHWLFAGQSGEQVTIRLEPLTDGTPTPLVLQITDSAGQAFLRKEALIGQAALVFENILLPRTGIYQAVVSGGRTPGIYRIGLTRDARGTQDDERAIQYGETVGKVLTPENFLDVWTFAGTKGDVITAAVRAVRGDRPTLSLQLRTQAGVVLGTALDEDDGSRLEQIVLPADGHYSLIVGNVDGTFEGEAAYDITLLLEDSAARSMGAVLAYGQTVEGYFFLDDSTDTWLIEGQQGDVIRATVRSISPDLYPVVELIATDWRAASTAGQPELLISTQGVAGSPGVFQTSLPATGTYALVVRDQALVGGPYTLELNPVPSVGSGSLANGQSQSGQIGEIHLADIWSFEGAGGETVTITVEPDIRSQIAPVITLMSAEGTILAMAEALSGSSAQIDAYPLPRSGGYKISVSRYLGALGQTDGRYTISLQRTAAAARTYSTITYDQVQRGSLGSSNVRDTWRLGSGTAGDLVRVYAEVTSGNLDLELHIVDADGHTVAHVDDGLGLSAELYWHLPEGGPFYIEVSRYGTEWGATEGNYALVVDRVYDSGVRGANYDALLAYGDRAAGSVDSSTRSTVWGFAGEQGDTVYAKLQFPRDDSPLALYLRDASGAIQAAGERDRGDAVIARFTLAYSGIYTLEVRRPGDARAVYSPYTLELALLSIAESEIADHGGLIVPGEVITGMFTTVPASHTWLFDGHAQATMAVTVNRLDGMLPYQMALYGPDGSRVVVVQAPPAASNSLAIATVQLPYDGIYALVITGADSALGSQYRLILREAAQEQPQFQHISSLEDGFGAITDIRPSEHWTFQAETGDGLTLRVSALTGDLRPTLIVWGPDRRPLAVGSSETGAAVINSLVAPEAGLYTVTVGRLGATTGEYRIMLRYGAISAQAGRARDVVYDTKVTSYTAGKSTAYYAFRGTRGDVMGISVRLTESGSLPDLSLETESGGVLRLPIVMSEHETYIPAFGLPADGRYIVRLDSHVTVGYALTIVRRQSTLPAGATMRSLGHNRTFAEGILDPARPTYWQFAGEMGDVVTFTVDTSGGGLRADITLFGPEGYLANAVEYPGPAVTLGPVRLPSTGSYLLVVGPWLGAIGGSTGQYTVLSAHADETVSGSSGGHIAVWDQRITGGLTAGDAEDVWTFDGRLGDAITLWAEQTYGEGSLHLVLMGPDDTAQGASQPATAYLGAEIAEFTLPADGLYTVVVSGTMIGDSSLEYRLMLSHRQAVVEQPTVLSLTPVKTLTTPVTESQYGRVTAAQPIQSWLLHPMHTGTYQIQVESLVVGATLDIYLVGVEPAETFREGQHTWILADLTAERDYIFLVSGGPKLMQGHYALEVIPAITLTQGARLLPDNSNVGNISDTSLHNEWRVPGQSSAIWTVTVTPTAGNLIPVVTLVAPTGAVLQIVTGSARDPLVATFQLPANGIYGIEISGVGQTTGDYVITLTASS